MEDSVSEGAAAVSNPRSSSDRDETGDISIVNVSGINTELWPEQEFGKDTNSCLNNCAKYDLPRGYLLTL